MVNLYIPQYDCETLYRMFGHLSVRDLIFEYKSVVAALESMECIDDCGYGTATLYEIGMYIHTVLTDVMAMRLMDTCSAIITNGELNEN